MEKLPINIPRAPSVEEMDISKLCVSTVDFQNFIYDLFERNGIMNDLRAHLRSHIVNVLKNAQTGDVLNCQKHFTKRLEYESQALNMLLIEYLLRTELNYTLSVLISEVPINNMVFNFSKTVTKLQSSDNISKLRFDDKDVCTLFGYLGLQLDSEYVKRIKVMYANDHHPLLVCVLKSVKFYDLSSFHEEAPSISITSTCNTSESEIDAKDQKGHDHSKRTHCDHLLTCKICQKKMRRQLKKYKKNHLRSHTHKIFEELKSVYDAEVEIMKTEEKHRIKQSVEALISKLNKKRDEMENRFRVREEELEQSLKKKKRFLCDLAKSLREQHRTMSKAMIDVQHETRRLTHKEQIIKEQLTKAETALKTRGEEMKEQISKELSIITHHLKTIKEQKYELNQEKEEIEKLKKISVEDSNKPSEVDVVKNEVEEIKKDIFKRNEMMEGIEEISPKVSMNNDERSKVPNQVVNCLKKNKNTNQTNNEEVRLSAEEQLNVIANNVLKEENERLKVFSKQQSSHIEELSVLQRRLQFELDSAKSTIQTLNTKANPIPSTEPFYVTVQRANKSNPQPSGCGEQVLVLSSTTVVPGDSVPFVGPVGLSKEGKRHVLRQWRVLRKMSQADDKIGDNPNHAEIDEIDEKEDYPVIEKSRSPVVEKARSPERTKNSNKNVQQHNKNRKKEINNGHETRKDVVIKKRGKSPTSVLREAKLRLRKLEVEAKAVEKSYKEFKMKRNYNMKHDCRGEIENFIEVVPPMHPNQGGNEKSKLQKWDIEKLKTLSSVFQNKLSAKNLAKPIPAYYSELKQKNVQNTIKQIDDYLETPLSEFRKLYRSKNVRWMPENKSEVNEARNKSVRHYLNKLNAAEELEKRSISKKENNEKTASDSVHVANNQETNDEDDKFDINDLGTREVSVITNIVNKSINDDYSFLQNIIEEIDVNSINSDVTIRNGKQNPSLDEDKLDEIESKDVLVLVESSIDVRRITEKDSHKSNVTEMTVIASPRNDETIEEKVNKMYSDEVKDETNKSQDATVDYEDDFSIEGDNFNRAESQNSQGSKDNFWEE